MEETKPDIIGLLIAELSNHQGEGAVVLVLAPNRDLADQIQEEAFKFLFYKDADQLEENHHTRFFQSGHPENVPPGTVIDKGVCHLRNNDF
ncbi:hypothetical protein CICLE_v10003555mg [Citrus x clementina]|uniref:Piwi domain-containing protein n=1 Tax=Citrus clementina TaxID=85681 RepID=V4T8E2_CITCL|nr:hypothetical protein CICLE_v10003555mg [Citrus x clementina]